MAISFMKEMDLSKMMRVLVMKATLVQRVVLQNVSLTHVFKSKDNIIIEKMIDALAKEPDKIVLPKPKPPDKIRTVCMVIESKLRTLSPDERRNKINALRR